MHSGTGGSATSLSLTQYAQLIQGLLSEFDCQIILTAGPGESEKAHELAAKIDSPNVVVYDKNKDWLILHTLWLARIYSLQAQLDHCI